MIRCAKGYYALQPGEDAVLTSKTRIVTPAQLALSAVKGMTIRLRRQWLWTASGKFVPTFIDQCVARCEKANKGFKLLVKSDGETSHPWSLERWGAFRDVFAELSTRYRQHPLFMGPHITGCTTDASEELPSIPKSQQPQMIIAYQRMIDTVIENFPETVAWLATHGRAAPWAQDVIAYGVTNYVENFGVKMNSLQETTSATAKHVTMVRDAAKEGAIPGFELVKPVPNIMKAVDRGRKLVASWKLPFDHALEPADLYFDIYLPNLEDLKA